MKRLLVLFAVLVPLSLLIAGCGGAGGPPGGPSKRSAEEKQQRKEAIMRNKGKMMQPRHGGGTPWEQKGDKSNY